MNDSIGCNSSTCPTIGSQSATVCLPVSISPYAVTGPACVKCRGSAVINHTCMDCKGIVNGKCDFVISQKIQIDLSNLVQLLRLAILMWTATAVPAEMPVR